MTVIKTTVDRQAQLLWAVQRYRESYLVEAAAAIQIEAAQKERHNIRRTIEDFTMQEMEYFVFEVEALPEKDKATQVARTAWIEAAVLLGRGREKLP